MIERALLRRVTCTSVAAVMLGLAFLPPAWAAVSRDEAATIAQHIAHGRVLAVERGLYVDNSVIWRITILTATGEVRVVEIDAATGKPR
jgi:drug/metabolite transporter superfamily protein YnfA